MVRLAIIAYRGEDMDLFMRVLGDLNAEQLDQLLQECPWR